MHKKMEDNMHSDKALDLEILLDIMKLLEAYGSHSSSPACLALSEVPHLIILLLGWFKNEVGMCYHLMPAEPITPSGDLEAEK